jgi:hypothetical protein
MAQQDTEAQERNNYLRKESRVQAGVDAFKAIAAEWDGEPAEEHTQDMPSPVAVQAETAKAPEAKKAPDADESGLAAIARAEARARDLFDRRESELKAREEKMAAALEQIEEINRLKKKWREDPIAVNKVLAGEDFDQDSFTARVYASLPDADEELKSSSKYESLEARLERMEAENKEYRDQIERQQQDRQMSEYRNQYVANAKEYIGGDSGQKDNEYVAAYFAENPQSALSDVITMAARVGESEGREVKPDEAVKLLNEQLSKAFGPMVQRMLKSRTEVTTKSAPQRTPADLRTLRNSASASTNQSSARSEQRSKMTRHDRVNAGLAWARANELELKLGDE